MSAARGEIWAYGFRNPWRFSFDSDTGDLWLGDVGQDAYEEIDLVTKGGNYGWNTLEGFHCYRAEACVQGGLELPVVEYDHGSGCSVTGGYVYRGEAVPQLRGAYVYADFCSGRVWAIRYDGGDVPGPELIADAEFPISSFGVDQNNELYLLGFDGWVYRFRSQSPAPPPTGTPTLPATTTPPPTPAPTLPATPRPAPRATPVPPAAATAAPASATPASAVRTEGPAREGSPSGWAIVVVAAVALAGGGAYAGARLRRWRREQR